MEAMGWQRDMLTLRVQIGAVLLCTVMEDTALLQRPAGNQTGSCRALVLLARLPPVGIVLGHNVQHIAALEGQTRLLARNVRIHIRIVVKVGPHPHFGLALGALVVRGNQLKGNGALRVLLVVYKRYENYIKNEVSRSILSILTSMVSTSPGVLPSTLMLLTSMTSSPT